MSEQNLDPLPDGVIPPPPGVEAPVAEAQDSAPEPVVDTPAPSEPEWSAPIKNLDERFNRLEQLLTADVSARQEAQKRQQQQVSQQQEAEADPEPDVYENPREHAFWVARQQQKTYDQRLAQIEQQDFNRRCSYGEEWLEDKGYLDEYKRLVNLNDPNNATKQYLDRNPDVWRELWNSNNPPKRLYQLAKDLDMRSPQSFEQRVQAEVEKQLKSKVDEAVSVALGRRAPAKISNLRPSVTNVPASVPNGAFAKDPKEMDYTELRAAAFTALRAAAGE